MGMVLLGYKRIGMTTFTINTILQPGKLSLIVTVIYRPVLRDLARILVLINRRDDEIPVPPDDWQRLFSWAERLLRRYKRHSSPEVSENILATVILRHRMPKSLLF